jgi:glycosyltransferase involved in cell wall biosynthesis
MSDDRDVLIVTQFFPPESMGGAHRWEKLAANLDASITPHVLTTPPTFPFGEFDRQWQPLCRETVSGVGVTRLWTYQPQVDSIVGRILNYAVFAVLSSIYVLCTFRRYDSIVTMSAPHTTFLPGLVGKLLGLGWIVDIFDLWIDNAADLGYVEEDSLAFRLVSSLEYIAFSTADAVFVITDTMGRYYEHKYPQLEFALHVVPFGVDTDRFSPDVDATRSTDIIYTGNLGTGQAFIPFLEAFAQLEGKPDLTIVGDGERREELEAVVADLGVEKRVTFEGYVSREEIPGFLAGATVSLVPLKTAYQLDYARPTKLLETMAVGTPYVASSVEEIAELSRTEETGVAVPNQSTEIRRAIAALLDDSQQYSLMSRHDVEYIRTHHDWTAVGETVSSVVTAV